MRKFLALLTLLLACQRPRSEARDTAPPLASGASSTAPAERSAAGPAGPRSARWRDALAEPDDALALARLADEEGAAGLLAALDEGGPAASVALAALPHADDADDALGPLGARLARAPAPELLPLLAAIEGAALRPRGQAGPSSPGSWRSCYEATAALAWRTDAPPAVRARAVSVTRLLRERLAPPFVPLPSDFDR